MIELEATNLRGRWFVTPKGSCGTCGFHPVPWTGYLASRCRTAEQAIAQARRECAWARSEVKQC